MSDDKLELSLTVRGSEGVDFREGWQTGDMKCGGVEICTVWYSKIRIRAGGCIDRDQARQLHRFLGLCISKWESEGVVSTD